MPAIVAVGTQLEAASVLITGTIRTATVTVGPGDIPSGGPTVMLVCMALGLGTTGEFGGDSTQIVSYAAGLPGGNRAGVALRHCPTSGGTVTFTWSGFGTAGDDYLHVVPVVIDEPVAWSAEGGANAVPGTGSFQIPPTPPLPVGPNSLAVSIAYNATSIATANGWTLHSITDVSSAYFLMGTLVLGIAYRNDVAETSLDPLLYWNGTATAGGTRMAATAVCTGVPVGGIYVDGAVHF